LPAIDPSLLHAAAALLAGSQRHEHGALYVVATPIGNLADITLRALHLLTLVDAVACEDTRVAGSLLQAYGLQRPGLALIALHAHNEAEASGAVLARLAAGERVALLSDAGTPAVSDPGARLVAAVRAAGFACVPLPGASSVTTALSVAGISGDSGFVFAGFLPSKTDARDQAVQLLLTEKRAVVILEAPHRMEALARAFAPLGARALTVTCELTKQFEEIATLPAADLPAWLAASPQRLRGEFALVLHPAPQAAAADDGARVLQLLLAELPLKTAVKLTAEITGAGRNELYETALKLKSA
jgi:16S rRNA (cytidine1402-2'-O)-methyltransferase